MAHAVLITLHATAGVIAFGTGCAALRRGGYFTAYLWSLMAMVGFLALAVGVDWPTLSTPERGVFTAFIALGGYVVWRAEQARRLRRATDPVARARLTDHVGFGLVALFDGFVVILALDIGAPGWVATGAGIAGVAGGHHAIDSVKRRIAGAPGWPRRRLRA